MDYHWGSCREENRQQLDSRLLHCQDFPVPQGCWTGHLKVRQVQTALTRLNGPLCRGLLGC